jgi:hypothetical protein
MLTQDIRSKDEDIEIHRDTRIQAMIETALIIVGLLAMFFLLDHGMYGDGKKRFQALSALLQTGHLPYTPYSMVGPFFSIPFWLLGKWLATPLRFCVQYNQFLFAGGLLCFYLLLKDHMDRGLLRKFLLLLLAASMFSMHVTAYYGEVFTALCVSLGILAILLRTTPLAGWIAIILGVMNTPATLAGLICMIAKYLFDTKRIRYILIVVVAAGLIMAESWIRRGSPFLNGYEQDHGVPTMMPFSGKGGFTYPFFFGLLSILFSFGKGIFFFAPGLLLPIRKTLQRLYEKEKPALYRVYLLWLCFLVGLILVYSSWWSWFGGLFWGPRFFLIASIPACLALAVRLHDRDNASLALNLFTLLVLCLSFWVGLDGAIFSDKATAIPLCMVNSGRFELLCHYTPDFSALWYPFVNPQPLRRLRILYIVYWACVFAYLLLPLFSKVASQTIEAYKSFQARYLNIKQWKF